MRPFEKQFLAAIKMGNPKVCINTNCQIVVNAVKGKMTVSNDILNLEEDIRWLSVDFKDLVLD